VAPTGGGGAWALAPLAPSLGAQKESRGGKRHKKKKKKKKKNRRKSSEHVVWVD